MMMKPLIVIALASTILAGCASTSSLSGDVYQAGEVKQAQNVSYGTIVSVSSVTIDASSQGSNALGAIGGAVLGGIAGSAIGGGKGETLATAAGAIGGGLLGSTIEHNVNKTEGYKLLVRTDDGRDIVVVQGKGKYHFSPNQRVMLSGSGRSMTVAPL